MFVINNHLGLADTRYLVTFSEIRMIVFNRPNDNLTLSKWISLSSVYHMGDTTLKETKEEKDLGVLVHKSLKVSQQCAAAAKKGMEFWG